MGAIVAWFLSLLFVSAFFGGSNFTVPFIAVGGFGDSTANQQCHTTRAHKRAGCATFQYSFTLTCHTLATRAAATVTAATGCTAVRGPGVVKNTCSGV